MSAQAGRPDFSAMLKISSIPADEPVVLLRAQDQVAADTARAWAALYFDAGGDPAVVEQMLAQADSMAAWPTKKLPDADHLSPAEQARLAYQLGRRAWARRDDVATEASLLAQQRGYALGHARGLEAGRALQALVELSDGADGPDSTKAWRAAWIRARAAVEAFNNG